MLLLKQKIDKSGMEHKRKLLATASCQAQGVSRESLIDRFSNVPEEVAHHILSFLTLRDLTPVGGVSKKCRELYLSVPVLYIDGLVSACESEGERLKLCSFVDELFVRRGNNRIQSFCIRWGILGGTADQSLGVDEQSRLVPWIRKALMCNAEVLDITIGNIVTMMIELPWNLFCSGSLKFLSVHMRCMIIQGPSLASFSNLEVLNLREVTIVDKEFCKWISCCCRCIKKLCLLSVFGLQNITIGNSSLEEFSFVQLYSSELCHLNISGENLGTINIEWSSVSPTGKSLTIAAPNLIYLNLHGSFIKRPNLGSFTRSVYSQIILKNEVYDINDLFHMLSCVCGVTVPILNNETVKVLEASMPAPLDDVQKLRLDIKSWIDDQVPTVVSLRIGEEKMSTLFIESYPSSEVHCKSDNSSFTDQHQEATIELSNGSNQFALVRYLLEHAKNLEEIFVCYSPLYWGLPRKLHGSKAFCAAMTLSPGTGGQRGCMFCVSSI